MYFFFIFSIFLLSFGVTFSNFQEIITQQNVKPPPQVILLTDRPNPVTIEVPTTKSGFYVKKNSHESKIPFEPPKESLPKIIFHMKEYTTENGLSMDSLHGGMIDKAGNIWIGTDGYGATKFDGQNFTNYTSYAGMPHVIVWRILEDKEGNIWFASDGGGAAKYDGINFTIYTTEDGLANNHLRGILEDQAGNIWFSTYGGGVSKFDGKTFTNYTEKNGLGNNHVFGITEDKKGNIWFATEGGVSKFDNTSFTNYTIADGLISDYVRAVLADQKGNIWLGTLSGVSKYDGKTFTTYTTKEGLANNEIWSILEDKNGILWFATEGGASEYDGESFYNYTIENGLCNNHVRYILEDQIGNIWFITYGGGFCKYSGRFLVNYILNTYARSIAEDREKKLWFSTEGAGTFKYDGKTLTNFSIGQGLLDNSIESSFLDNNGNLWFGTQKSGVSKYDGKSFTTYTKQQGLPDNWIWSILQDKSGNFWFSTDKTGVSKFDGKSFINYTTEQGLAHNDIRSSLLDKNGNIWFTTDGGGISKFDGKVFTNYTAADGLADDYSWASFEDELGIIWFGTMKGVSRFDGSTFLNYTGSDGLPNTTIANFVQTKEKDLVIGTQNGIAILKGYVPIETPDTLAKISLPPQNRLNNEELKKYKPVFEIYNIARGYPIKDGGAGQNGFFIDSKGIIWMATGSEKTSLVRMDTSAEKISTKPLEITINKIKINNENIVWSDLVSANSATSHTSHNGLVLPANITEEVLTFHHSLNPSQRKEVQEKYKNIKVGKLMKFSYVPEWLELPYSKNNVTVNFNATEVASPQDILYQYKLEGYDKTWSPPSDNTSATFGNIYEGNYQLKIKAQNPPGVWSKPITYEFTVLPPWYRTWWVYSLYIISVLITGFSIHLWRTSALRKQQKVLEKTVTARTAELVVQKEKSDELLLNILPYEVAEELKEYGSAKTQSFEAVTVLFTDFKNFTQIAEKLTADELVKEIDYCFKEFDRIISRYPIEKIKTIGDAYMAAGGLPVKNETHAKDVVNAALEIVKFMEERKIERKKEDKDVFGIRVGINTGPVVAGVVGSKKFAYDIWGDTVNLASRMESSGEEGRVNISENTYQRVKNDFNFIHRGKVMAKGIGEVEMYFVNNKS